MDIDTLEDALAAGEVRSAQFIDMDWRDLDAAGCRFDACVFQEVRFTGVDFSDARFRDCLFVRCRLSHAKLRDAVLEDCRFVDPEDKTAGCTLAFSDLRAARLTRCDLSFSVIDRCTLFDVEAEGCSFMGARFHLVDFRHALSRNQAIHRASFRDCTFELADLSRLSLREVLLVRCRLRETDLQGVDLTDADLRDSDLFQAIIAGARLDGADLRGAEISGLDIRQLAGHSRLTIAPDQQHILLAAMGIDVCEGGDGTAP
ncbi:pentapeptide repeat-containing protein [Azospirillum sp. B4]|uniref:pentapeptide repeat-containing protein n=1 Tax=Azospirillum sp. B4 TaxID=95605 RepID=UPI0003466C76|nr:pentapeptide repeat-containing protein [Azospirillum sp. B4]